MQLEYIRQGISVYLVEEEGLRQTLLCVNDESDHSTVVYLNGVFVRTTRWGSTKYRIDHSELYKGWCQSG